MNARAAAPVRGATEPDDLSDHCSKGVLGDVGVHILDFASLPVGPIRSIQARLKTFTNIKGKRLSEYPLDANDSALMQVEYANGALGVIHTTRWATGHANSFIYDSTEHNAPSGSIWKSPAPNWKSALPRTFTRQIGKRSRLRKRRASTNASSRLSEPVNRGNPTSHAVPRFKRRSMPALNQTGLEKR
ncbi:MAG: Gfo/Idh/MocA family oxidoreductase [Chthoniobacterales bacterium]